MGQDRWPARPSSRRQAAWIVCPHGSTVICFVESNRYSKQTGQFWCMLFSTHTWLSRMSTA